MDQNGPFWPEHIHFGAFGSANRTVATPEKRNKEKMPQTLGVRLVPDNLYLLTLNIFEDKIFPRKEMFGVIKGVNVHPINPKPLVSQLFEPRR